MPINPFIEGIRVKPLKKKERIRYVVNQSTGQPGSGNEENTDDMEEKDFSDVIYLFQQVDKSRAAQRPIPYIFSPHFKNILIVMSVSFFATLILFFLAVCSSPNAFNLPDDSDIPIFCTSLFDQADPSEISPTAQTQEVSSHPAENEIPLFHFLSAPLLTQHSSNANALKACIIMSNTIPDGFDMYAFILALLAFQAALAIAIVCDGGKEKVGTKSQYASLIALGNLSLATSIFTAVFLGITIAEAFKDWNLLGLFGFLSAFLASCKLSHISCIKVFDANRSKNWLRKLYEEKKKYIQTYNKKNCHKHGTKNNIYICKPDYLENIKSFERALKENRNSYYSNITIFIIVIALFIIIQTIPFVISFWKNTPNNQDILIFCLLWLIYLCLIIIDAASICTRDILSFFSKNTGLTLSIVEFTLTLIVNAFLLLSTVNSALWLTILTGTLDLAFLISLFFTKHETIFTFDFFFKKRRLYLWLKDLTEMSKEIQYLKAEYKRYDTSNQGVN